MRRIILTLLVLLLIPVSVKVSAEEVGTSITMDGPHHIGYVPPQPEPKLVPFEVLVPGTLGLTSYDTIWLTQEQIDGPGTIDNSIPVLQPDGFFYTITLPGSKQFVNQTVTLSITGGELTRYIPDAWLRARTDSAYQAGYHDAKLEGE